MGKERIGVDMGNKMVEFAGEDRSSRVGVMEDRQNDQHARRRSACVEIMIWHEMYLIVKKITRIAVIWHAIEIRKEIQERTD